MKKKIIITAGIVCLLVAAGMVSCRWNQSETYLRSMVSTYGVQPKELDLSRVLVKNNGIDIYEGVISMWVYTSSVAYHSSTGEDKITYDTWCRKHGDMSYNREERMRTGDHLPHEFIAADYTAIDIASDSDWDEGHPAGTSLNDITMFYSVSPIKYIQSGYSKKYDWSGTEMPDYFAYFCSLNHSLSYPGGIANGKTPFYPVIKPVSELKPEDMVLLGNGYFKVNKSTVIGFLEFTSFPTENKTHNITVTLTTDEGEVFSDTIGMTFE